MNDKKILIVDFDTESLIALSNLVYEEGFQAETATDGLAAYEKFRSCRFDLVILEPMLPKLHGYELCKRIVGSPDKKVPIIVVTAIYREPACRQESLTVHGAAAFFTKPYDKEELRAKMLQLLVERQERPPARAAEPVPPRAQAAVQTAVAAAPPTPPPAAPPRKSLGPDLRDILGVKPVAREAKPTRPVVDIEKELQEVVSGFVGPAKKKEVKAPQEPEIKPLREEPRPFKATREARDQGDRDIDVLIKDAIGGLAGTPKKKKPETSMPEPRLAPAPKPAAPEFVVKPAPVFEPEVRPVRPEKIPVAREIKQGLPFQAGKPTHVPRQPSRLNVEKESRPFDIDKTLIEIDKIPFDIAKPAPGDSDTDKLRLQDKKKGLFEEYSQPPKRKMSLAIIGAAAGVLLIATTAAFFVLKPKKADAPASKAVAAVQPASRSEFVAGGESTKPYPDAQEAELKAEPKRPAPKPVETTVDIGAPIQPVSPSEGAPVHIQEQPGMRAAAAAASAPEAGGQSRAPGQPAVAQPSGSEASTAPAPGKVESPAPEKAIEGALIPLAQVDSPPVVIKRVDPKYPPLALRSGVGGTVTINALISDKGDVVRTEILKGIRDGFGLEAAAETALRAWKFKPAQKDGVNVKVWKSYEINFKFSPKSS